MLYIHAYVHVVSVWWGMEASISHIHCGYLLKEIQVNFYKCIFGQDLKLSTVPSYNKLFNTCDFVLTFTLIYINCYSKCSTI